LATTGVCVFCATTSVAALFVFGGSNDEKGVISSISDSFNAIDYAYWVV
jgi:hypothetical protein